MARCKHVVCVFAVRSWSFNMHKLSPSLLLDCAKSLEFTYATGNRTETLHSCLCTPEPIDQVIDMHLVDRVKRKGPLFQWNWGVTKHEVKTVRGGGWGGVLSTREYQLRLYRVFLSEINWFLTGRFHRFINRIGLKFAGVNSQAFQN
jgi:hypothetical protein